MFKPVSFAYGTLAAPINATSQTLILSQALYNQLVEQLGEDSGDTTYLLIGSTSYGEIVRVDNLFDGIATVTRGMDGTTAKSASAGTYINYHFCASAVRDMIAETTLPQIEIHGQDGIIVQNPQPGVFYIGGYPLDIVSSNGTLDISGGYPSYDLSVNPSAFGLCNTGISTSDGG